MHVLTVITEFHAEFRKRNASVNFCTHIFVNKCLWPSVSVADFHTPHWKHWITQESAHDLEFSVCLWLTRLSSSSISVTRLPRLLSASCSSLSGALCGESMCCQRQEDEIWLSWTYDWQVESRRHGNQDDTGVTSMRFPAYRLHLTSMNYESFDEEP